LQISRLPVLSRSKGLPGADPAETDAFLADLRVCRSRTPPDVAGDPDTYLYGDKA
jgi:hypothetical protein